MSTTRAKPNCAAANSDPGVDLSPQVDVGQPSEGDGENMPVLSDNYIALGIGGLSGAGPGIAGFSAWIVAAVVIVLLAALARWTMRPSRRATAGELRRAWRAHPLGY